MHIVERMHTMTERWWLNGVLTREVRDGIEIHKNVGKTYVQLGITPPKQISKNIHTTNVHKVMNLARAAGRVAKAILRKQAIRVSDEEQRRRMAICATCEFFTGTTCRKCGCHIRFKAKLQTEHCPIGKW